ncbi:unnamed protein product [Allacma fusca]|uniref:Protein FAM60A n=1 Tax=Allacma fusca TaxID=39272 RepID=A0A8J2JXR0_9HEXA|nr:unnamed protein product [Allacma fusca]
MFSFHKPRVYRSVAGCCICRAKSSSSRFTDSKRYEDVFFDCFKLREDRSGEICNACVLLVKRWKKLPQGSQRNWNHVVDARAGHGSKPLSKINKVKKNKLKTMKIKPIKGNLLKESDRENGFQIQLEVAEKMKKKLYIPQINRNRVSSPSGFSDDIHFAVDCLSSESGSCNSSVEASPVPSPGPINVEDEDSASVCISSSQILNQGGESGKSKKKRRSTGLIPQKNRMTMSSFLDLTFWKREKTCCGIIFKGPFGEVLLDRRFLNPCYCRSNPSSNLPSPQFETIPAMKVKGSAIECFSIETTFDDDSSKAAIEAFRMLSSKPTLENKLLGGSYVSNYTLKVD